MRASSSAAWRRATAPGRSPSPRRSRHRCGQRTCSDSPSPDAHHGSPRSVRRCSGVHRPADDQNATAVRYGRRPGTPSVVPSQRRLRITTAAIVQPGMLQHYWVCMGSDAMGCFSYFMFECFPAYIVRWFSEKLVSKSISASVSDFLRIHLIDLA